MSTLMLDHLIDDNAIDIHRDDVRFIQDLILSQDAEYVSCGFDSKEISIVKSAL